MEGSRNAGALAEQMLADAYDLVLSGWCQGESAQDEMGRAIEPSSAFARSWSLTGALERIWRRATGDQEVALEGFERANLALAAAVKDVPERWNDAADRAKGQVLDALLEARRFVQVDAEESLLEDLLDDLDRYRDLPVSFSENPA
jgi:hypothetical protein